MGVTINNLGAGSVGGLPKAQVERDLYAALQYSGFVTSDMTYEQILEALSEQYPQFDGVFFTLNNAHTDSTGGWTGLSWSGSDGSGQSHGWTAGKYYAQGRSVNATAITGMAYTVNGVYVPSKYKYMTLVWNGAFDPDEYSTYFTYGAVGFELLNSANQVLMSVKMWEDHNYNADIKTASGTNKFNISSITGQVLKPRIWARATGTVYQGTNKPVSCWIQMSSLTCSES